VVWVVEAPHQFLILKRPNVNIGVLATYSQQRVVGGKREATDVDIVPQGHQTLCFVASDVVQSNGLVHAQSHDKAHAALALVCRMGINVAPFKISDGALVVIQAQDEVSRLGRPDEHLLVLRSR